MTDKTTPEHHELPWQPIATMPEGVEYTTKIDDGYGVRNIQKLVKRTRIPGETRPMFWSGDVYVYYTPTHWLPTELDQAQ
jgi:hypothetical protein